MTLELSGSRTDGFPHTHTHTCTRSLWCSEFAGWSPNSVPGRKDLSGNACPFKGFLVYPEESSPTVDLLEVVPYFFVTRVCDVPRNKDDGTEAS